MTGAIEIANTELESPETTQTTLSSGIGVTRPSGRSNDGFGVS